VPYPISQDELNRLGGLLTNYYEEAWQAGIKGLFDNMARSQMGIVTGYLDMAKDTWTNFRKKSSDSFMITFKPELKAAVGRYFANKSDVMTDLVNIGEKVLSALASHIPVPYAGTAAKLVIGFAADKGRSELHERSVTEADKQLAAKSGGELAKFFTSDTEAAAFVAKSIDQYKTICKFIDTTPKNINTFDDAVTFPGSVFKVQAAASSLNVALMFIEYYLDAMRSRLVEIQTISKDYIATVRKDMPGAVHAVLERAYAEGYAKGQNDITKNKYAKPGQPQFQAPTKPGGATQLAAYVAHALSQGYYDSGNTGPRFGGPMTRPRSTGGPPPPPPLRH
jgi:hypothetical protein